MENFNRNETLCTYKTLNIKSVISLLFLNIEASFFILLPPKTVVFFT